MHLHKILAETVKVLLEREKPVVKKITLGDDLDSNDIFDLFMMLYEYELTKSPSISSMFFALWSQLLNGLRSDEAKSTAREAFEVAKKMAILKTKQDRVSEKISAFEDDSRLEGILKDLEDRSMDLEEELRSLSKKIASVYIPQSKRTDDDTDPDVNKEAEPTRNYKIKVK